MKNETSITVRVSEEAREKLQREADLSDVTMSDILRKVIEDRINEPAYVSDAHISDTVREKQTERTVELRKEPCPFCGVEVDWSIVKIHSPFLFGESGKRCPSCNEMVFVYSEKKGLQKRSPESEEEEDEDDIL